MFRHQLSRGRVLSRLSTTLFLALTVAVTGCSSGGGGGGDDTGNTGDGTGGGSGGGTGGGATASSVLAVIGDYGDDDDDTRAVADLVKGWSPDYIVTVGDNDYSDGAYKGTFTALEFSIGQYFHDYIGNYQGSEGSGATTNRFFPTPGDHDWGDTCDDPTGLDDYLSYFTLPASSSGNERYYDFRKGDLHFFSIHSLEGCEPDGVTPTSTQGQWVENTAAASDAPFKIAYFHQPPYSSGANHQGEGDHMRWPWKDWGFSLVLAGNDHIYERVEVDGVTYLVVGLGGVDIHPFAATPVQGSVKRFNDDYGALKVEVFADHLRCSFITVAGTVVDTFTIQAPSGSGGGTGGSWYQPGVSTTWQWQLQPGGGGTLNTSYDVDVYDIDLFDAPQSVIDQLHAAGRKVVCYFSAGSYEAFRDDAGEFAAADLGNTLEGFADERWVDIRSTNVRSLMAGRLELAVTKQCDGVEPDNVDGYQNNPGFALTAGDQLEFNRFLAAAAHDRGLAVGLKNDLDQIPDLVGDFDFAVNEQCHEFDECDQVQPFIDAGKPVFNAEYEASFVNDTGGARAAMCAASLAQGLRSLVLPLDLDDSFRHSCDSP